MGWLFWLKPRISQSSANVLPGEGRWDNYSPHLGLEDGLTAQEAGRGRRLRGREHPVVPGLRGGRKGVFRARLKTRELWQN